MTYPEESDRLISEQTPMPTETTLSVAHSTVKKWRISAWTRFFTAIAASTLAIAVLISLVSIRNDRNSLAHQVETQSVTLVCRSAANVNTNKAIIAEQIAVAKHNVLVGRFIVMIISGDRDSPSYPTLIQKLATDLTASNIEMDTIGKELTIAVEAQQRALKTCG